ncbi:MAG: FeoA family protein [Anaerovoracaceae bacterium]|jgi:ferrous iron transport protein A
MNKILPLNSLKVGEKGCVQSVMSNIAERRRLLNLGLINGTIVEVLHKSPAGDPTAYSIMGAVIALRNADAKNILVQMHL